MDKVNLFICFIFIMQVVIVYLYYKMDVTQEVMTEAEIKQCSDKEILFNDVKFITNELQNLNNELRVIIFAISSIILFGTSRLLPETITSLTIAMNDLLEDTTYVAYVTLMLLIIIQLIVIAWIRSSRLVRLKKEMYKRIEILNLKNSKIKLQKYCKW